MTKCWKDTLQTGMASREIAHNKERQRVKKVKSYTVNWILCNCGNGTIRSILI